MMITRRMAGAAPRAIRGSGSFAEIIRATSPASSSSGSSAAPIGMADEAAKDAALFCTAWATSCARRASPPGEPGTYSPLPKTISRPQENARASTSAAAAVARGPV